MEEAKQIFYFTIAFAAGVPFIGGLIIYRGKGDHKLWWVVGWVELCVLLHGLVQMYLAIGGKFV